MKAAITVVSLLIVGVFGGYSDHRGIVSSVGHRGYSSIYPENTIIACEESLIASSEGIEFDLRISQDDEHVVMHDSTLDRTTNGTGRVDSRDFYGYMNTLDAGSWKNPQFAGEPVPLLSDIMDIFFTSFPNRFGVLDLKDYPLSFFAVMANEFEQKYSHSLSDNTIIGCWTPACTEESVRVFPSSYWQMFIGSTMPNIDDAVARGLNILSLSLGTVRFFPDYIAEAQSKGIDIHVWTVNSESDIRAALALGVNGIISDYPERVIDIRDNNNNISDSATPSIDPTVAFARACMERLSLSTFSTPPGPLDVAIDNSSACARVREECGSTLPPSSSLSPSLSLSSACVAATKALFAEMMVVAANY